MGMSKGGGVTWNVNVDIPMALKALFRGKHLKTANGLRVCGAKALEIAKKAAGSKAMSPSYLSSVDHPYARRHGDIQTSSLRSPFSGAPLMVGKDKGDVQSSIKGKLLNQYRYKVFLSPKSQHVIYVIQGTRIMIGRDVIGAALATQEAQKEMFKAFVKGAT